jgi:hypothetical protein
MNEGHQSRSRHSRQNLLEHQATNLPLSKVLEEPSDFCVTARTATTLGELALKQLNYVSVSCVIVVKLCVCRGGRVPVGAIDDGSICRTHTHTHTNTHKHTHIHTLTHTHTHTHAHMHKRTHIHAYTHKRTNTHAKIYTHEHTRKHTQSLGALNRKPHGNVRMNEYESCAESAEM